MDRQGFFSIDVIFAVTLLLTIAGIFSNIHSGRDQASTWIGAGMEAKLTCEKIATAVNAVYANGSTLELYIDLPATIGGHTYSISFDNLRREITIDVPDAGITGSTAKATTTCKNIVLGILDPSKRVKVYLENSSVVVVNI
jgi:hypothetical protein